VGCKALMENDKRHLFSGTGRGKNRHRSPVT
jgi:hypothetical protein